MTRDELKKALPEMVMFAKNEEERAHYKKLQGLDSNDLEEEVKKHAAKFENENKPTSSFKTRRT